MRSYLRWRGGAAALVSVLTLAVCQPPAARAANDPVAAALEALFDAYASDSLDRAVDERLAERLDAARPVLVHELRRLPQLHLLIALDGLLASYSTLVQPGAAGEARPPWSVASGLAIDLAVVVRWGDLATARLVAPAANVVALLDVVLTKRRHLRESAAPPTAGASDPQVRLPTPADLRAISDQALKDLLQLDYDLVGAQSLQLAGSSRDTRMGKKLQTFEGHSSLGLARLAMRRLMALGHTRVTDPVLGPGAIVSVP